MKTNRRNFIRIAGVAGTGMLSSIPGILYPYQNDQVLQEKSKEPKIPKIWACLLHLSVNWEGKYYPTLRFDESLWNDVLKKMVEAGMNMIVIDLNDAIRYDSHPEIAVYNAWSTTKLRDELAKIRSMGLEPIPKLNFSSHHDPWLKDYGRMVTSSQYHDVCRDLIAEVIDLFDVPRLFHLGMDEEYGQAGLGTEKTRRGYGYGGSDTNLLVVRQNGVYWADMFFLIGEVFRGGPQPWVWQDYIRYYPEKFAKMMPKSVLQSGWYNCNSTGNDYDKFNNKKLAPQKAYLDLEALRYDQVPGGSNYYEGTEKCFFNNVKFCSENIADQRLLGFIQSSWKHTIEENRKPILSSIEQAGEAKKWFDDKHK